MPWLSESAHRCSPPVICSHDAYTLGVSIAAIGAPELIIALVLVLLLFGSTQLPKLARSLGQAKRELKQATDDDTTPKGDQAA